ncbi:MAG: GTP cyclohydrolase I FolE [Acidobacteria bacterium]|nr:GTP cyclohydrolase I FolE [Acidobacteriota bacterium]
MSQTTEATSALLTKSSFDLKKIADGVRLILEGMGEDPNRPGLQETPERVAEMYAEICGGLYEDASAEVKVLPSEAHEEIVMVKDITLNSLCEHHLIPFTGVAHVAYIPQEGRIVGLSKLARIVDIFARRPQVQERLTTQVADVLYDGPLKPNGVLVVIEAVHLCMTMRGIKKPGATTVTSALRGVFRTDEILRAEAMAFLKR